MTFTLLDFANFFHLDPWHVMGFCCEDMAQVGAACECGDAWDDDLRSEVQFAIEDTIAELTKWLGFAPQPTWYTGKEFNISGGGGWLQKGGNPKTVNIAYLSQFGLRIWESLGNAAVTSTDDNMTFALTLEVDACGEFHFFLPDTDTEVLPLTSSCIDGTLTATFPGYALGKWEGDCLPQEDSDSYYSALEVRSVTVDGCQQGIAIGPDGDCGGVPCGETSQSVCLRYKTTNTYTFTPAQCVDGVFTYVGCSALFKPTRLELNYQAGHMLDANMRAAIAFLAASKLVCSLPTCDCKTCYYNNVESMRHIETVKIDSDGDGTEESRSTILVSKEDINNAPFGVVKGAIKAWKRIKRYKLA